MIFEHDDNQMYGKFREKQLQEKKQKLLIAIYGQYNRIDIDDPLTSNIYRCSIIIIIIIMLIENS